MSAAQPLWDLAGHVARARHPRAQATLDLWAPAQGLRLEAWDDVPLAGCELLGIEFPGAIADGAPPPDCYVRGGDLVATYPATPERPSRVQAYWRLHAAADSLLLDVQVSVQTHLLDARPKLRLVSRAPRSQVWQFQAEPQQLTACATGFRATTRGGSPAGVVLAGHRWQYLELLHPEDDGRTAVELDPRIIVAHELFDEQLEKGVILRARARGVLLSQPVDAARAGEAYRAFLAEPLPLST